MEEKDNIVMPTAGRAPLFEEPVLDVIADESSKKLREKEPAKLTANDKYILDLMEKIPLDDLFKKGYVEITQELTDRISAPVTLRSMNYKQIEVIANDVSRFQQQKDIEKFGDNIEREVWRPSVEETRLFQMKRTLCEMVNTIAGNTVGRTLPERMSFFDSQDNFIVNALYRRAQQFLTALSLLFPSENQKEFVATLKKASAPLQ